MNYEETDFGEAVKVRGVDFGTFFENQQPMEIPLLTALRMSASFPYITPTISLPSEPLIEIMDAGISDNYGVADALHFISIFKDWIEENTSGVVLLVIRDTKRITEPEQKGYPSLFTKLTSPISSVYNNLSNMQDIENDKRLGITSRNLKIPLQVVNLEYDAKAQGASRASLSWHLTEKEKQTIVKSIELEANQRQLKKLKDVLN